MLTETHESQRSQQRSWAHVIEGYAAAVPQVPAGTRPLDSHTNEKAYGWFKLL